MSESVGMEIRWNSLLGLVTVTNLVDLVSRINLGQRWPRQVLQYALSFTTVARRTIHIFSTHDPVCTAKHPKCFFPPVPGGHIDVEQSKISWSLTQI